MMQWGFLRSVGFLLVYEESLLVLVDLSAAVAAGAPLSKEMVLHAE
jgi:hypothetical protein